MTYETIFAREQNKPENKDKSIREIAQLAGDIYWSMQVPPADI